MSKHEKSEAALVDDQEFSDIIISRLKEYSFATFERSFNDMKDGLRPVMRRSLYTMWELGLTSSFKKVQYVAGAAMKYHPYNSDTIADSIVLTGQWFSTSYPLIDGQGNFGSVKNMSNYAAPRYIECKLSKFAQDCITSDIDDHCITYVDNYDATFIEPEYLPTKVPLTLIQRSWGIGEAFITGIPPYNLNDVVDCCVKVIKNKNISLKELMKDVYPDYPTGGIITNKSELDEFQSMTAAEVEEAAKNGKTYTIKYRGKCEIDRDNNTIIITELPDKIDFDAIFAKIHTEVQERNNIIMSGIINKGDHQDPKRPGNMIFELICKKDANLLEILNQLYIKTPLSSSQSLSYILYCGEYLKRMSFKDIILHWYHTQYDIKRRKFNYLLSDAQNKIHVLEGLVTVYDQMDKVIKVIKESGNKEDCISRLVKEFHLSLVQAKGISEMQLYSLTRVSKNNLLENIKNLKTKIEDYENSLENIDDIIIKDLLYMKNKHGRPRRTTVVDLEKESESTSISISNGAILYSRDSVGIFDSASLINGKTILNSMKPFKIDGKNVKEIIGYHPVEKDIRGAIVFNKDGTGRRLKISDIPITNNWIICNDQTDPLTCVVPLYDDSEDCEILVITDEYKVRKFKESEIGKKVQTGVILGARLIKPCEKEKNILIYNEVGEYIYVDQSEIPLLGRNSSGNMTSFNKGNVFNIIPIDSGKENNLLILFTEDETGGYYSAFDEINLEIGKRTNVPKKLVKLKHMKFNGVGLIDSKTKNDSTLIFISGYNTSNTNGKYVKDGMDMRKVSGKPFGIIQI